MQIYGSFLIFGADRAPEVHLLGETRMAWFSDRCDMASKNARDPEQARRAIYAEVFGAGAEYAIPCWNAEAMTLIGTQYTGPHQQRVRFLAAAIALGKPYGGPEPGEKSDGPSGGTRERVPVKPKPSRPQGGARVAAPACVVQS
jgi:hypothetical protein